MKFATDRAKGEAKKAVGMTSNPGTHRGEGHSADAEGDPSGSFGEEKTDAKEIFEDARSKQEEAYIRLGKPD